jgi:hypothetical protein
MVSVALLLTLQRRTTDREENDMAATLQAQRAIESMIEAGFSRREFSVRTETRRWFDRDNYVWCREYGDAIISVKCVDSKAKIQERIPELCAAGLSVFECLIDDPETGTKRTAHPTISTDYRDRNTHVVVDLTSAEYLVDATTYRTVYGDREATA